MLSREAQNQAVYNKATYYKAMQRNGWFLPNEKEPIVTLKLMRRIRAGKIWCPQQKQVHPI